MGCEHSGIILESCRRDTAPAIALAAFRALKTGNDPVLVVLPSDHYVEDSNGFCRSLNKAVDLAESGKMVLLGIEPSSPETGYGYILRERSWMVARLRWGNLSKSRL